MSLSRYDQRETVLICSRRSRAEINASTSNGTDTRWIHSLRTRFFRVDHRVLVALRRTAAVGVLRLCRLLLTFLLTPFGSTILEPYLDGGRVCRQQQRTPLRLLELELRSDRYAAKSLREDKRRGNASSEREDA